MLKNITKNKSSKYGIFNRIFQFCCQKYILMLKSLKMVKQVVITKVYSIIRIFKLELNDQNSRSLFTYVYLI